MQLTIIISFFLSLLIADNNYCNTENFVTPNTQSSNRTYYNIGDIISQDDQEYPYNVCHGDGNYDTDSSFKLSDYSGNIILISMNATWWPACYEYISLMDEIINFVDSEEHVKFIVSLDYTEVEPSYYDCSEWGNLYSELGDYGNDPLILKGDPNQMIWNMFAGSTYSAYVLIDHNMTVRYKFDMPNLYDFQYTYIPNLLNELYGCTDSDACNYDSSASVDDGSCEYGSDCINCSDFNSQLECMSVPDCMWMGNHCMEANDDCMTYQSELECMNADGCYWMGNHCMAGDSCTDPIAYNYNPIADILNQEGGTCEYSPYINFGCNYIDALNYDSTSNVDDGTCQYNFEDLNNDGDINILDILYLVDTIINP